MIMTKEKEFEEEEKTTSEDEEEHYVESLKYNEIMELISDAQLLKTMLNVGSSYPKLIKEFMVKNDGIPHGLLNFSYKLFVRKDVLDICPPGALIIDEYGFGNILSLQSKAIYYCIIGFMYQVGTHATWEYGKCCLCQWIKHIESQGIQPLIPL